MFSFVKSSPLFFGWELEIRFISVGEILVAEDMEAEDDALVFQPGKPLLITPFFTKNLGIVHWLPQVLA
jgi:hypothetical protein